MYISLWNENLLLHSFFIKFLPKTLICSTTSPKTHFAHLAAEKEDPEMKWKIYLGKLKRTLK